MYPNINKHMLLVTVILMDLLTGMEFDIFVPSFPELQQQFNLSAFLVEALLSVNFAGYCLSLFFVGALSDSYGRKPIILLGLFIFIFGSMLCLITSSYPFFLFGRFLQGVGVAAPSILSFLIIADTYSLKQQQFLMAMLNTSLNIAAGLAPVIGSYITLYFHWQGNFTALLLIGCLTLFMTFFFIPAYPLHSAKEAFSLSGYFIPFKSRPLTLLILGIIFMFVPYWVFVGVSPLLYIKDLNVSLAHFGYYQGILAFVFALGSLGFGLIIKKTNYNDKCWLYMALLIFVVSIIMLVLLILKSNVGPLLITFVMLIFVMGQIIPSTILYPLSLNIMPKAKGRIAALTQGGRLIFSAVGLQIAGYYYHGNFQSLGIIIVSFILLTAISLFLILQNKTLFKSVDIHNGV